MAQVLIRNLDDTDVAHLKRMAESENVSLEQKLRTIVSDAARRDRAEFWELAAQMRAATRGANIDIEALIQEGRDRDPLGGI